MTSETAQRPHTLRLVAEHEAAVLDECGGWTVPGVYPTGLEAEYAAAREGQAHFDLSDRGLLSVTGPERVKFLHNILSNDVKDLAPGRGRRAALMDVKGHLLSFLRVLVEPTAVILEASEDSLATVEATLQHYRVGSPVRFSPRDDIVLGVLGPGSAWLTDGLGGESHRSGELGGEKVSLVRATDLPVPGCLVYAPSSGASRVWRALVDKGSVPMGRRALDALRVEAGRPWYGRDVTTENLLHETGLLGEYHSFTKGCYVGQEVIARLEARGARVNKRLMGLTLSAPVPPGSRLLSGGGDVGRVTTSAVSPRLGPIALAYLHRDQAEAGVTVEVGEARGVVTSLPMP